LIDDFEDDVLGGVWRLSDSNDCVAVETGGAIELALAGAASGYCELGSRTAFDLDDSELTLHFRDISAHASVSLGLSLSSMDGDAIDMRLNDAGQIWAAAEQANVEQIGNLHDYEAALSPWWRIAESDGVVSWQVSADGESWNTLQTWTANIPLDALDVDLTLQTSVAVGTPVAIRLEGVNP
jgi:hypothetical protein